MTNAKPSLILAIDQGTTGTTCLVVDAELRVLARATHDFPQHFPQPGWVEHDPQELWQSVLDCIADVVGQVRARDGVEPDAIRAIGITNQRETSLLWSRADGKPVHRAIVWQDRRTADRCRQLKSDGHADAIRQRTGLVLDPYFSGTKLAWVLDSVSGARTAAERGDLAAGTIDTYLCWRLSGGRAHVTEPSNASRTMLWPLQAKAAVDADPGHGWDPELCQLLGVPAQVLPAVRPCTAEFGRTQGVPGLPDDIPIHGIAGDQQAALFGQACFDVGEVKCTYGTGAFVMLNTGREPVRSSHGMLTTVGWQLGDETTYALEGSAFMAGAVVQWLRDGLGLFRTAPEVEALAREVEDSDGVVLVPAHAGLGAPHWRPEARGLIRGLTRGTTRSHIARAALEGIALEVTDLVEAMGADLVAARPGKSLQRMRVDGGAAANDLLMQMQANILGLSLDRPQMLETTALGAIFLAGLGAGIWRDTEALSRTWQCEHSFDPGGDPARLERLRTEWRTAVQQA